MTPSGIIVIVIGVAILAVAAWVVLRRPIAPEAEVPEAPEGDVSPDAPAGAPGPVTIEPPVRSVSVEGDEIVVDFAVPLPSDADEWLTRALTSAALEAIRRRESEFSLDLGQRRVTAVVAKAGRHASERVGSVPIEDGRLPEPMGPAVQVDVATGAQPLLAHADQANRDVHPDHGPDELAPAGRGLELTAEVRNGLIAQGIDPGEDDGGRIGRGVLVLAGYTVTEIDPETFMARRGTEEVLVRIVPEGDGGHPELTESDVSSFLVALGSVPTRSGLLVTGKLVPFHLYSKEHDDVRIVGRQRLQAFVDGLVG